MLTCSVIGLGYIGLPTAILLAKNGVNVFGVDINADLLGSIQKGNFKTNEPNLKEFLSEVISNGSLTLQTKPVKSDVFIICVPTPFKKESKNKSIPTPYLEYVYKASKNISKVIEKDNLVILESTSPVGTTQEIFNLIEKFSNLSSNEFNVAYCPERVIPGNIFQELVYNDRVIGGLSEKASEDGKNLYKLFCKGEIVKTEAKIAELVKLAENSFRDVNLAFANELSIIGDHLNINSREVIRIANKHPRVNILKPGCGVGGHCIAVDPWFIAHSAPKNSEIIQTARKINTHKSEWVFNKIDNFSIDFEKRNSFKPMIALMGLSYKPDVDDIRESAALRIALKCKENAFNIKVCEPNLKKTELFKLYNLNSVLENTDIVIFLVAHSDFRGLDIKGKDFMDFCGIRENN